MGWALFSISIVCLFWLLLQVLAGVAYCIRCWALITGSVMFCAQLVSVLPMQCWNAPVCHHACSFKSPWVGALSGVMMWHMVLPYGCSACSQHLNSQAGLAQQGIAPFVHICQALLQGNAAICVSQMLPKQNRRINPTSITCTGIGMHPSESLLQTQVNLLSCALPRAGQQTGQHGIIVIVNCLDLTVTVTLACFAKSMPKGVVFLFFLCLFISTFACCLAAVPGDVHLDLEGGQCSPAGGPAGGAGGDPPGPGGRLLDRRLAAHPDDVQPSAGRLHHLQPLLHGAAGQLCRRTVGGGPCTVLCCHPARGSRAHR